MRIAQGEADLRKMVRGFLTAGVVRSYLPQNWVIITDQGALTVHADLDGNMTVSPGEPMVRDGAIAIGHDLLADSLRTGKNPPANAIQVTFYTPKGQAAFRHLAKYFGM